MLSGDQIPGLPTGRFVVLALSMTHGMQHFFGRIFPPLIPLLATDLTLPLWKLGLIMTLWGLANGLAQTPMGQLSDRYDRRFLLPGGVALVGIGYGVVAAATAIGGHVPALALGGASWSGPLLVITLGMVIAGIGKAATHPTGYPLISANVAPDREGRALGRWGSASKLGDAAGPAFVGLLILVAPWQYVFATIAVIAMGYAVVLFAYMTASGMLTVPAARDDDADEEAADADRRDYLVPVGLVLLSVLAAGFASRGLGTYLPTFISEVYAFSFTVAGMTLGPESVASLYFSAMMLSCAAVILVVGDMVDDHDPCDLIIVLYTAAAIAVGALSLLPLTPLTLLAVTVVIGGTLYATNPARDAIITRAAPEAQEGRVFGYFWTAVLVTSSLFPVLIGYISDLAGIRQGFLYLAVGPALGVLPIIALRLLRD